MPSSPASKIKPKSISSFFISPSKHAVNLANQTAGAVSNAVSKSLSNSNVSHSLNSLKLENGEQCKQQNKLIHSPLRKKIKLSEKLDESDYFDESLLDILGAYDTTNKAKTIKLKQSNETAKVDEDRHLHVPNESVSKGNNFPSYLFYVVEIEVFENENNYIHLRLKKVDSSFPKQRKGDEDKDKINNKDYDHSITSCFLYDSWYVNFYLNIKSKNLNIMNLYFLT